MSRHGARLTDIPGVEVDGDDVLAVYEKAGEAIARARRGEGPTLLECLTYRWFGHHVGDPGTSYRPKDEIAAWKARDPVAKLRQQVLEEKMAEPQGVRCHRRGSSKADRCGGGILARKPPAQQSDGA